MVRWTISPRGWVNAWTGMRGEPSLTPRGGKGEGAMVYPAAVNHTPAEPWNGGLTDDLSRILLTTEEIQRRTAELGRQLAADYAGKDPLLVGILSGSFLFIA